MKEPKFDRDRSVAKQLYLRCDDAGSCSNANEGILAVMRAGVKCNVSVMATGPVLSQLIPALKEAGRTVCVGLHVTLTSEWDSPSWGPLRDRSSVPSLLDWRMVFHRDLEQLSRFINIEEAIAETRLQLDQLRRSGLMVDYLDEHMAVGLVGGLRERLIRLAKSEGLIPAELIPYGRVEIPDLGGLRLVNNDCTHTISDLMWVTHPETPRSQTDTSPPPERVKDYEMLTRTDLQDRVAASNLELAFIRDAIV